jgi:hypothetical protein
MLGQKKLQNVIAVTESPSPVLASNAAEGSRITVNFPEMAD